MLSVSDDENLESYFTNLEHLRDYFDSTITSAKLIHRILVIHGVGGIGKTSLLRMFRLKCKRADIPVALASGDEDRSAVGILNQWADDLRRDKIPLPKFTQTVEQYLGIQAKAESQAKATSGKLSDLGSKAAGKIAETATGAAIGALAGSFIPGIGTLAGALGGMSAEALVDWLRSQGFGKADIELILDPTEKLTADFLSDI